VRFLIFALLGSPNHITYNLGQVMNKITAFLSMAICVALTLTVSTQSRASEADDFIAYEISRRSPNFHVGSCAPEGEFALLEFEFGMPTDMKKEARSCVLDRNGKKSLINGGTGFSYAEILQVMGFLNFKQVELEGETIIHPRHCGLGFCYPSYSEKKRSKAVSITYKNGFSGELEIIASDKTTVVEKNEFACGDRNCVYAYWHVIRALTETGKTFCEKISEKNSKRDELSKLDECNPEDYYFQVITVRKSDGWKYLKSRRTAGSDPFIDKWQALSGLE
jgi:hypothetical protein